MTTLSNCRVSRTTGHTCRDRLYSNIFRTLIDRCKYSLLMRRDLICETCVCCRDRYRIRLSSFVYLEMLGCLLKSFAKIAFTRSRWREWRARGRTWSDDGSCFWIVSLLRFLRLALSPYREESMCASFTACITILHNNMQAVKETLGQWLRLNFTAYSIKIQCTNWCCNSPFLFSFLPFFFPLSRTRYF